MSTWEPTVRKFGESEQNRLANVGESGEYLPSLLANVGESEQNRLANVGESGEYLPSLLANVGASAHDKIGCF